jgi:hypothetical protein
MSNEKKIPLTISASPLCIRITRLERFSIMVLTKGGVWKQYIFSGEKTKSDSRSPWELHLGKVKMLEKLTEYFWR